MRKVSCKSAGSGRREREGGVPGLGGGDGCTARERSHDGETTSKEQHQAIG